MSEVYDHEAGWLPTLTATRLQLPLHGYLRAITVDVCPVRSWLDEVGGIDWSGLPCGWLVR